jgi:hypothetical protein
MSRCWRQLTLTNLVIIHKWRFTIRSRGLKRRRDCRGRAHWKASSRRIVFARLKLARTSWRVIAVICAAVAVVTQHVQVDLVVVKKSRALTGMLKRWNEVIDHAEVGVSVELTKGRKMRLCSTKGRGCVWKVQVFNVFVFATGLLLIVNLFSLNWKLF